MPAKKAVKAEIDKRHNHFMIGYPGNKRLEFDNMYEEFKSVKKPIKYVVEPFCGTSAFSYFLSRYEPGKYTYVLNDNNPFLIKLYHLCQDEKAIQEQIDRLEEIRKTITKEKYNEIRKNIKTDFETWLFCYKYHGKFLGSYPDRKDQFHRDLNVLKNAPIVNFLKTEKVILMNKDAIEVMKEYDNEDSFIMLDPPYLETDNSHYVNADMSVYEYLENVKLKNFKASILMIVGTNWVMRLIFKEYIKKEYSKMYQAKKNVVKHLVISNYF